MKKSLKMLLCAAIVICGSARFTMTLAQNIQVDDRGGYEYADIDSVPVAGLYGCYDTRLCLYNVVYTAQTANYDWRLLRAWVVDSATTEYYTDLSGHVTYPVTDTSFSIGRAYLRLWQYAADSAVVDNRFLLNVNFK